MASIDKNKVVFLNIESTHNDLIIDSTFDKPATVDYLHGYGTLIPALEMALEGLSPSEQIIRVPLAASEAFGEYDDTLIQELEKKDMPEEYRELGTQLQFNGPDGLVDVYVSNVTDDKIEINGNHPLAGKDIVFQIQVLDVKDAHEDEIKHKRVNPVLHNIMTNDSSYAE